MKPDFALDFRDNQITLLHRQQGGWAAIGRVSMDDPDLDAAMGYLRATALGLSPRGIATKLILPNEAILYTNLPDLPHNPAQRAAQIAADLTGRTPYAVADLVWDWTDNGASADVAVIARETLEEAEGFASQHRFNPISFAAIPNSGGFDGEVWFGATQGSVAVLAQGEVVERDEAFAYAAPQEPLQADAVAASDFEMGEMAELDGAMATDTGTGAQSAADEPILGDAAVEPKDVADHVSGEGDTAVQGAADADDLAENGPSEESPSSPEPAKQPSEAEENHHWELRAQDDDAGGATAAQDIDDDSRDDSDREVWQDFAAHADEGPHQGDAAGDGGAALLQPSGTNDDATAPEGPLNTDVPASFAAAMAELPPDTAPPDTDPNVAPAFNNTIEQDNAADGEPDEAPMAVDVPILDADDLAPDAREVSDAATIGTAQIDAETVDKDSPAPNAALSEPRPSKAEQMLAAFSARRAAALAKTEAAKNSARIEPVFNAQPTPAEAAIDVAADDDTVSDRSVNSVQHTPADKGAPKLTATLVALGKAPEITAANGLRPMEVKHVPAKSAKLRPQNLKSMPKPASSAKGFSLIWVLLAALMIALIAAGAMSQYVLESFNRLFVPQTAIVSVEPDAANVEKASAGISSFGIASVDNDSVAPQAIVSQPKIVEVAANATSPEVSDTNDSTALEPEDVTRPLVVDLPILPQPVFPPPAARPTVNAVNVAVAPEPEAVPALAPKAEPEPKPEPAKTAVVEPAVVVTAAAPSILPPVRPEAVLIASRAAMAVPATAPNTAVAADPALANARPLARPDRGLSAQADAQPDAQPAADPALANARPLARPEGILAAGRDARLASAPASLVAAAEINAAEAALDAAAPTDDAQTPVLGPLALSVSRVPAVRPKGLRAAFDAARDAEIVAAAAAASAAPVAPPAAPAAPAEPQDTPEEVEADNEPEVASLSGGAASRSVVAKQATIKNVLNLNTVNLVGIFGNKSNRYALIRQPSGSFKKLKVGDRFDGGKIAAITESEVRYAKGGQMLALQMPKT